MIDDHLNLRFDVLRYTGEIYMAFVREKLPPGFASSNEFALAVESLSNWSTVICQPHQPERIYYGLYGGELPAEYDVSGVQALCLWRVCCGCSFSSYIYTYLHTPPKIRIHKSIDL